MSARATTTPQSLIAATRPMVLTLLEGRDVTTLQRAEMFVRHLLEMCITTPDPVRLEQCVSTAQMDEA